MQTDNEYLQCLGMGLQGLRASGQFCDAMVCVGSTRILVHKVVLSAASKTLHDLALEFDMMPHRERDQLEIIIPPDISLYAVNMFIKYLYTGQLELREMVVGHLQRLAQIFGVSSLLNKCQEYTQQISAPDSQNLNIGGEERIEPDSSSANGNNLARHDEGSNDASMAASLTRSNSSCSGVSTEMPLGLKNVKLEHHRKNVTGVQPGPSSMNTSASQEKKSLPSTFSLSKQSQDPKTMNMLEKLMSPVVNIQKLPSEITPDVVVMVSDDEDSEIGSPSRLRIKPSHHYTLAEKEAIAVEAKRYGTTHVANSHNISLPDVLSWMTLFGLRHPGGQKSLTKGKPVNHDADMAVVRWIVQHQDMNGCVDLGAMKQYALTVYRQSQPNFQASVTWLGNFLKRNMSVLQGTKFVQGNEGSLAAHASPSVSVKRELMSVEDLAVLNPAESHTEAEENMNENPMFEDASYNDAGDDYYDDGDNDDSGLNDFSLNESNDESSGQQSTSTPVHNRAVGVMNTPFGKRPIIVGQSKCFDFKSEKKIVNWVLERNARDGYVFTDDFKDFARSLYTGSKPFGATKAWMTKFLRRNRAIKDVKFCSKFKNMYTNDEKMAAVVMARKYGTTYAAKHTGISHKMIHCWRLAMDRGQLNPAASVLSRLEATSTKMPDQSSIGSPLESTNTAPPVAQALHGIIPEFERQIIERMKEHVVREGGINYNDISKISQEIYKETRPTFKASYSWIRTFLDRNKEETKDIDIENVSKVVMEDKSISQDKISEMVDNALKQINEQESETVDDDEMAEGFPSSDVPILGHTSERRPIVVGPSVMFDRKTEKQMVEWVLERQHRDGYVFTDDFKDFAKSLHTGPKRFSASSGWMTLFLRRHRDLRIVQWKSKFKNNYTEEEKMAAIAEAKRLGTGHVGRKLGIDPALICAWRIKLEKTAQKQTFWKGTKIRKFGKGLKIAHQKLAPIKLAPALQQSDAARGIVPEFEQRIVQKIQEEHAKEGSISYEEMSSISQSIYKETRPTFKASYAWIRNFMKRHESELANLNIENVKKVFIPEDEEDQFSNSGSLQGSFSNLDNSNDLQVPSTLFQKRPIIVGQSRSLDAKTEKKLVQWLKEQQEKNGYVFLDQFKSYAQSLYKGSKKFAATQAWRIKFLRRNHAAVKHVKFTSSFRNQYSVEEKKAIVLEARKFGAAHVAKKTGIDHSQINAWRLKFERSGEMPTETASVTPSTSSNKTWASKFVAGKDLVARRLSQDNELGPGLYSHRGIVPKFEKKIVEMVNNHMDDNGSVTYQDVSNIARAVYKETRPHFKACYNWIKEFIKRHKKGLRHVEFEHTRKILLEDNSGMEVLIPEDKMDELDLEKFMPGGREPSVESWESFNDSVDSGNNPEIVIENAEDPHVEPSVFNKSKEGKKGSSSVDIENIASKKPVIIGTPVHFDRKTEKKIVEWLLERQARDEYVFTDDLRTFARSLYTGPPNKFAATNAWISKFLRRNKLKNKIVFQSKLKGNNSKYEEKIVELVLEHQQREGSVSNDDIQKITQSVYKEIRPNFRACYNWIRDFIKRHKNELASVELENVKKVFIPDDEDGNDGVLVRDYDPMMGLMAMDPDTRSVGSADSRSMMEAEGFGNGSYLDSSWTDLDSSQNNSGTSFTDSPSSSVLQGIQKKPIIIAPPKSLDIKTEKKLVQWMQEQQQLHGCVYLDLFKEYAKSIHTGPKRFAATQAWMIKFKQRNHEALKNVVIKSRFRNEYSLEEKIAAVEEAKRLGCNHVGRKLGINGGVIYSWKVQIEQAEKKSVGMEPDTEKASFRGLVPEFEERIIELVQNTQALKDSVSYDDVSKHARSVYCETRPNFKASYNWVIEFIRKYKDRFENVNFENQRKMLNDEEKLQILSEEKKYGTEHVIKKRNISASTIYNWKKSMHAKAIPIPKYKALVGNKIKQKYAKGKKVQKSYTDSEKRKTVAVAEENGITYASLKLGISRNLIAKWVKYFRSMGEDIVINFTPAATIKKGLEQKIVTWVLDQNDQLGIVMTNRIQEHANKVFEEAYTNFSATEHWLEVFISQNAQKFENVRFREKGDTDLEFTEEIKLRLSRYAEKYGAVETANLTGLAPKNIYHWRRILKSKGYDLTAEGRSARSSFSEDVEDDRSNSSEPKSLMQQKLDKIEQKHSVEARKTMVTEALTDGTSAIASKYKIPLPLLLKWMKLYPEGYGSEDRKPDISSLKSQDSGGLGLLKVRLPSVERARSLTRYSDEYKKKMCIEAQEVGVREVVNKHGIPLSTLYAWKKEFDATGETGSRQSVERLRESVESSRSSFDSEMDTSTPSTPIPIQNIKKEPLTNFPQTHSNQSSPETSFRAVRRYSDEERTGVVQKALEIGARAAAKELNIPISNVLRWTSIYKKKQKQVEIYEKQKQKKQEKRQSQPLSQPDSIIGQNIDNMGMQNSGNYMSFSNLSQNNSQLVATPIRPEIKERVHSSKYSEDERFNFVLESDIHGSKAVAEKAGVSVDVMYKWRQKYSARPRVSASSTPLSSSSRSSSASLNSTPLESAPIMPNMLHSSDPQINRNENDNLGTANLNFQENLNIDSDNDFSIVENTDYGAPEEFEPSVSLQETNTTDSIMNTTNDNLTDMPTIFQLENSAASKVLEMTSDYLDAEMEHESLLGGSVTGNSSKLLGETNDSSAAKVDPSHSATSETPNKGELDFIQIINVKSEAPE